MAIKIHRILKDDLTKQDSLDVVLSKLPSTCAMTIDHYSYSIKQSCATLNFEVDIVHEFLPYISNIDFAVSVRKEINLTATGPNEKTITDVGADVGEYDYKNSVPTRPTSLPPGFQELYRG